MWAIMALGLNVVVGYAGLLDLGYVAFWAIGGYTAGWLMAYRSTDSATSTCSSPVTGHSRPASTSTSGWCCIIAGLLCALAGIIIGAPTLRLAATTSPWSPSASAR